MEKSKQVLLLGLGLSCIYPFFWWTFLYVPIFSFDALFAPSFSSYALVSGALIFAIILAIFEQKLSQICSTYPWAIAGSSCLSALLIIILWFIDANAPTGGLALLVPILAFVGGGGIALLLFAWGKLLIATQFSLRDYAMAFCGSLFLFFGYVLLLIGVPGLRFLLCIGLIISASVWLMLQKNYPYHPKEEQKPASSLFSLSKEPKNTAASTMSEKPKNTETSSMSKRLKNAATSTVSEEGFSRLSDWIPSIVSYIALSVVYWLLFSCDAANAFPEGAFATLGSSPIGEGQPFLYALFLLYLALVFIGFLANKPHNYQKFFFILQGINSTLALISLFAMTYLIPSYADIAEGLNCLIRANIQISLFVVFFFIVIATKQIKVMLLVPIIDAALLLLNLVFMANSPLPYSEVALHIPDVSFACGVLIALCFISSAFINTKRMEKSQASANLFSLLLDTVTREYGLSEREREVFALAARGYGAKGIAQTLNIANSTAQTHISRIYAKIDVHSKQELLQFVEGVQRTLSEPKE